MHFPVVIIGAGPAGLACAKILGQNGIRTLIVEKKQNLGSKVCAGGLTWGGLAGRIPESLIERAFPVQHIKTRRQSVSIGADHPIIVTVNRENLGRFMADQALRAGAQILSSTRVVQISQDSLIVRQKENDLQEIRFDYLVGADGSSSLVRRHLGVPALKLGIGLNYQLPGEYSTMEWHLNAGYFKNGYGWIFPHKNTFSIGAYVDASIIGAGTLQQNLIRWAQGLGIDLSAFKCQAEFINFDFRGWDFGNIFLVGEAAGLASALTGEGIYPAIISGEEVARKILDPQYKSDSLARIIKKHSFHQKLVELTGKNKILNAFLSDLLVFALRIRLLNFHQLEMTD